MTDWKRRTLWLSVAWFAFLAFCVSGAVLFSEPPSAFGFWTFIASAGTFGPFMAVGLAKGSE